MRAVVGSPLTLCPGSGGTWIFFGFGNEGDWAGADAPPAWEAAGRVRAVLLCADVAEPLLDRLADDLPLGWVCIWETTRRDR